jgi:RNA polymerase sigma-70 factor (ECF subfamily)
MTTSPAPATQELEVHRRELTAFCYRMLGSGFDAEDAVQETMVRAWRAGAKFDGRSSLRSWLYRIATNICLDMLRGRKRRAVPMELGPSRAPVVASLADRLPEGSWVSPIPDERLFPLGADPAELAEARESVRLAFVAALQHLPPRQRAVLILCEVLRWSAAETAELLDTSVAAVNSSLQRARATLAEVSPPAATGPDRTQLDADRRDLLTRYVDAFERYDMTALVKLLHEDAIQSMPPFAMWLQGATDIAAWMVGPGAGCRGSRLLPTAANGCLAFGQYRVDEASGAGGHAPWALQVIEVSDGRVSQIHSFLEAAALFPAFGLPDHLPA